MKTIYLSTIILFFNIICIPCMHSIKKLHNAVHNKNITSVQKLLAQGYDPNEQDTTGWTPLIIAIVDNHRTMWAIIDTLLRAPKIQINLQDSSGSTALHYAAQCGFANYCKLLLQAGANPTIQNNQNETPLTQLLTPEARSNICPIFNDYFEQNRKQTQGRKRPIDDKHSSFSNKRLCLSGKAMDEEEKSNTDERP